MKDNLEPETENLKSNEASLKHARILRAIFVAVGLVLILGDLYITFNPLDSYGKPLFLSIFTIVITTLLIVGIIALSIGIIKEKFALIEITALSSLLLSFVVVILAGLSIVLAPLVSPLIGAFLLLYLIAGGIDAIVFIFLFFSFVASLISINRYSSKTVKSIRILNTVEDLES